MVRDGSFFVGEFRPARQSREMREVGGVRIIKTENNDKLSRRMDIAPLDDMTPSAETENEPHR